MKSRFAGLCFTATLIFLCCWGIAGALIGGRIPFIPSSIVRELAIVWIPVLTVVGWLLTLAVYRDSRDVLRRRKLVELYAKRGWAKASLLVFLSGFFFYVILLGIGDAGISKSAVFLSPLLPSEDMVIDVPFLGARNYSRGATSLQWVKVVFEGHVDDFSFPVSQLTFLPCPSKKIRISGNLSWAGIRVNHVECSQ